MTERLAYPLKEGAAAVGISRSRAYEASKSGRLLTYKDGKRRMVSRRALLEYIAQCEREAASQGAQA